MKVIRVKSASLIPWLWGINGATSVCASVSAEVITLNSSISLSFRSGLGCYSLTFLVFV